MISADRRIQGTIRRLETAVAGNAALEFFARFLHHRLFERISAAREKEQGRRGSEESDREGLQAQRILKKVISDK